MSRLSITAQGDLAADRTAATSNRPEARCSRPSSQISTSPPQRLATTRRKRLPRALLPRACPAKTQGAESHCVSRTRGSFRVAGAGLLQRPRLARVRFVVAEEDERLAYGTVKLGWPVNVADGIVAQPFLALGVSDGDSAEVYGRGVRRLRAQRAHSRPRARCCRRTAGLPRQWLRR